jgi:hypothetical protein
MTMPAHTSGDVVLRRVGERFEIVSADPIILIAAELLTEIELGCGAAGAELLNDGVLELRGLNRTVRYQLGRYLPWQGVYEAAQIP